MLDLGNGEAMCAGSAEDFRAAAAWLRRTYPGGVQGRRYGPSAGPVLNMGASNALAAYALYAGKVPSTSLTALVYMALVSKDSDTEPWWSQGHAMLAIHCLGREPFAETGDDERDRKAARSAAAAVERAVRPLFAAGAITVARHSSGHPGRTVHVRYRLWLVKPAPDELRSRLYRSGPDDPDPFAPHGNRGVHNSAPFTETPQNLHPGESAPHGNRGAQTVRTPRKPCPHPTVSVTAPHENRGTKEYEENEERIEEQENMSVSSPPASVRAREDSDEDGDVGHEAGKPGGAGAPLSEPAQTAASDATNTPVDFEEHRRRMQDALMAWEREHPEEAIQ